MHKNSHNSPDWPQEHPNNHMWQLYSFIAFMTACLSDTFLFKTSSVLQQNINIYIRLAISAGFFFACYYLIRSVTAVYDKMGDKHRIIRHGVFAAVRHPMYLGMISFYIALTVLTVSMLSFAVLILIFFLYNRMAAYEEKRLLLKYNDEYTAYKKEVSRWIPFIY